MHPLKPLARNLRKQQTNAESIIWFHIRNRQIAGVKFKRQVPLGKNIFTDFISYDTKVIVEIDGGQHNDAVQKAKDDERTKWFELRGNNR